MHFGFCNKKHINHDSHQHLSCFRLLHYLLSPLSNNISLISLQSDLQAFQICSRARRHSRSAVGPAGIRDLQSDLQALQICSRTCRHSRSAVGPASIPNLQSDLPAFQICSRTCRHSRSAIGSAGIPDLQSDLQVGVGAWTRWAAASVRHAAREYAGKSPASHQGGARHSQPLTYINNRR